MDRKPIISSHIASVGHENNVLEVEYASGVIYRYTNVPPESYAKILTGESPGRELRSAIHQPGVVGTRQEICPIEMV